MESLFAQKILKMYYHCRLIKEHYTINLACLRINLHHKKNKGKKGSYKAVKKLANFNNKEDSNHSAKSVFLGCMQHTMSLYMYIVRK
jgi:hypothetical protein